MKLPHPLLANVLKPLARPRFAVATPGGSMLFASGGSDDDRYDEYDVDTPYDDEADYSSRRPAGAPRGGGGSGSGGGDGGRRRTVQFQPEERYWTEYLRIALPIIGLLLMIALFWFWASQLANDNGADDPVATQSPGATELVTPDSTPEPTEEPVIGLPTEEPATATTEPPIDEPTPTPTEDEEPTEEPEAPAGEFQPNQSVVTTDALRLRTDASTSSDILATLDAGTVLTIQDGPFEADEFTWWEVVVEETGQVGFVAQDFIEPAPEA